MVNKWNQTLLNSNSQFLATDRITPRASTWDCATPQELQHKRAAKSPLWPAVTQF